MLPRVICTTLLVETSPQAIPLGAACIASAIKADPLTAGQFSVGLADFSLEDAPAPTPASVAEGLAKSAGGGGLFAVCFSVYVWNHNFLEEAARELKKLLPDVVCIAGGPEVTAAPTNFTAFDYTVAGQGEGAVPRLLADLFLKKGENPSEVQGVYQLEKKSDFEKKDFAVARAFPCPTETLASPYLDGTIDLKKYGGALWELARGCPFKCAYCYESKGEPKVTNFPLDRLEKEIELFAREKISQVFVLDPTYNANKERAISMLRLIAKKAPGIFFYFEARAEFIDRQLAKAFASIPCALQIGLQSADEKVLANVHRTLDKKKFIKNIGFLNEEGVVFGFDLIYGLPGDTFGGFCKSIDFALELYPNNLELFCLSVLPGTTLHDTAAGFGMEWEKNPPYHVLKTPQFPPQDLKKAESLSRAVNIFYTQGRAVPYFNAILAPLKMPAHKFFEGFEKFLAEKKIPAGKNLTDGEIENLQLSFVEKIYRERKIEKLLPAARDLILVNNGLSRCTNDGSQSIVTTTYHPDDIMSEYGQDLAFFYENFNRQKCRVQIFMGGNGPDWRTI